MATNSVDVLTEDGSYLRALTSGDIGQALKSVTRILGTDRDVSAFQRRARGIPWLAPLAQRMSGFKPPRHPDLFEACANTIAFQQVSLHAASAIMRRLVISLGTAVELDGLRLSRFPSVESYLGADDEVIRGASSVRERPQPFGGWARQSRPARSARRCWRNDRAPTPHFCFVGSRGLGHGPPRATYPR
jgi:hypothetical protein